MFFGRGLPIHPPLRILPMHARGRSKRYGKRRVVVVVVARCIVLQFQHRCVILHPSFRRAQLRARPVLRVVLWPTSIVGAGVVVVGHIRFIHVGVLVFVGHPILRGAVVGRCIFRLIGWSDVCGGVVLLGRCNFHGVCAAGCSGWRTLGGWLFPIRQCG
jgi:hypothetical protein